MDSAMQGELVTDSAMLGKLGGEEPRGVTCGASDDWEPDRFEADLVKRTGLSSYVRLKSKLEPTVREKAFGNCRDRWNAYWAANLATLYSIGSAKYLLDRLHGLAPTLHDTQLLRLYVPAFFTGITASLDCLALEIHLLICLGNPSLESVRKVAFTALGKKLECSKDKLECAAKCRREKEAGHIEELEGCVIDSEDAKKLRKTVFDWRNAYAHRSIVATARVQDKECVYLLKPNLEPCELEKLVPRDHPLSSCEIRPLLADADAPLPALLEEHWQRARRIIDESWSVMAIIADERRENTTAQG